MLIERDEPLEILRAAAGRAAAGRGGVVVVSGEAGVGKTSLLAAHAASGKNSHRVLWGACEALFTPRALGPLHDMAPALDPRIAAILHDGAAQTTLFPAVLTALQTMRGTATLIFEDVHWADNATLDLIKYLGRRMMLLKALLIVSLRSDEVPPEHPLAQVLGDLPANASSRIALKPLSEAGVATLAEAAGQPPGDIYRVTLGNPFFVTELLQRGDSDALPSSIRDAVWSRLSRLDREERALIELMSIVPGSVEHWLPRELLGRDADSALEHGIIERDAYGDYRFRHELARLATLERLSPATQQALHARVLDAMLGHADPPLPRLVHHAAGAGNGAKVLEWAPRAAAEAARVGAHQQAAAHLATALRFADVASAELAAQLNESWSYEAGLALKIDDAIIDARHRAITHWEALGRTDKVGHNLRWLSRLHWYRGDQRQANDYLDRAIAALETTTPGPELAMAYSARSQLHMLNDRTDDAIAWGQRAIALAEAHGEIETRVHALNNVATALLFSGRDGGPALMAESLSLALRHGLHEQAARAYTNFAEYAVLFRDFPLAERLLAEGIAFDSKHDLDAWTHYLLGRQAQLRMDQGRFAEAQTIATGVLALERLTLVMHLPALMVLGKVRVRLGEADGRTILRKALTDALATGEQQNIVPVRLGLAEAAWLADDLEACRTELRQIARLNVSGFDPWERGDFAVWWQRAAMAEALPDPAPIAAPRRSERDGHHQHAADQWLKLGLPYEAGLSLVQSRNAADLAGAVELFQSLGARAAEGWARRAAKDIGAERQLPRARRGPYSASRAHPLGLTGREAEILDCIAEGLSNRDIAAKLARSRRTVEHHVSALLGKLNATSRLDVLLRLRNEPWLTSRAEN